MIWFPVDFRYFTVVICFTKKLKVISFLGRLNLNNKDTFSPSSPQRKMPSWPWSYGSWIYNYLCNQCLSPLMLWVRILIRVRCTICQWLASGRWFSPSPPVFSTNKTDRHDYRI